MTSELFDERGLPVIQRDDNKTQPTNGGGTGRESLASTIHPDLSGVINVTPSSMWKALNLLKSLIARLRVKAVKYSVISNYGLYVGVIILERERERASSASGLLREREREQG